MTTNFVFLRLALPTPLRRLFDYLPPQDIDILKLKVGVRVRVPFQSRILIGILVSIEKTSDLPYEKLKTAIEVLDHDPILTPDVYKLCHWAAEYYHYSVGEVLAGALPASLRKGKAIIAASSQLNKTSVTLSPQHVLNQEQATAVSAIQSGLHSFQIFLLQGVTGSGKTEVYLQAMAKALEADQQVLVLVPEISLTPQTLARFEARFSERIVTIHSAMTDKARTNAWVLAKSGDGKIVIGTRSAIFTPFVNLGLIIVDEEHDPSFKQQDHLRYHARDLAVLRARYNQCPVVLGSATPSLESLLNAQRERYTLLKLPVRAGGASLPDCQLIDLRATEKHEGLSNTLLQAIEKQLANNNQVLLFLNRRGFAPVLYCIQCAKIVECKRCDARMVYHQSPLRLHCHHCDAKRSIPKKCSSCDAVSLEPIGMGTERVELLLQQHFPSVPIIRIDRDTTKRKGAMNKLLEQVHTQPKAILLGTQMLAKGHHFPRVTLVGILDADTGLFSADFRAAEHMGQLLTQVSGRAGRGEQAGLVMIQTYYPEHPLLQTLIQSGYELFSNNLLAERKLAVLPPYSYVAIFRAEAYQEADAHDFLIRIKETLPLAIHNFTVSGPVSAVMSKRKGLYRQQLVLQTNKRSVMQALLKHSLEKIEIGKINRAVKWVLDVDPVEV